MIPPRSSSMFARAVLFFMASTLLAGAMAGFAAPTASAQSAASVNVQNFAFSPSSITVVIGVNNTVTWTNHDLVSHTVTADGNSFAGPLSPGGTFTHTFTTAGTYSYHCSIHTYMKGEVKVLGAGGSSQSTTTSPPTSSATTSSYGGSGGIPEFPFQAIAAVALTVLVAVSYLAIRRHQRS